MPYIKQEDRGKWKGVLEDIADELKDLPVDAVDGNLNYLISSVLKKAYPAKYFNYNRAIGMLECVKQEFYRRDVGPYEDKKIEENGDVD